MRKKTPRFCHLTKPGEKMTNAFGQGVKQLAQHVRNEPAERGVLLCGQMNLVRALCRRDSRAVHEGAAVLFCQRAEPCGQSTDECGTAFVKHAVVDAVCKVFAHFRRCNQKDLRFLHGI